MNMFSSDAERSCGMIHNSSISFEKNCESRFYILQNSQSMKCRAP